MQFVSSFLVICLALLVCTPANGPGALCALAPALTLIVFCVRAKLDRLARIKRHLETLVSLKQSEANPLSGCADTPSASETNKEN